MGIRLVGIVGLTSASNHAPHNELVLRFVRGLAHTPRLHVQTPSDEPIDEAIARDLRHGDVVLERVSIPTLARAHYFVIDLAREELWHFGHLALLAATGRPVRALWVHQRERDCIEFLRDQYALSNLDTFVDPETVLSEIVRD